jgi:hypothetical protein
LNQEVSVNSLLAAIGPFAGHFRWYVVVAWVTATVLVHLSFRRWPAPQRSAPPASAGQQPAGIAAIERLASGWRRPPTLQRVRDIGGSGDGQAAQLEVPANINADAPTAARLPQGAQQTRSGSIRPGRR